MSSRRRNFCFLNLLNLALSPFCDDICPRSSSLFVTQRAEDKSVRSSIRQVTDGRCETQGTLRRNPLQRLRVRLLGLLPGCPQNVLRYARSILHFSKDSAMSLRTRKLGPTQRAAARFPRNGDCGNLPGLLGALGSKLPKLRLHRHHVSARQLDISKVNAATRGAIFPALLSNRLSASGLATSPLWGEVAGDIEDEVGGVGEEGVGAAVGDGYDGHVRRDDSVQCIERRNVGLRFARWPPGSGSPEAPEAPPSYSERIPVLSMAEHTRCLRRLS